MTEVVIPSMDEPEKPVLTPIKQMDAALKACTFGCFHIKLLAIAFTGYMCASLVSSTTGYLLPVAECDLNMTLLQKGLLNAMPYTGMLFSAMIAGFLTDAFGRKIFLIIGFSGQFIFTIVEASSQTYEVLSAGKFLEGLFFAACFSPLLAITSEFSHNSVRDRIILLQSSLIAISQILIAVMSWAMLMADWKMSFFGGKYVLNTWNFYLYAVSLWPLAACVLYGLFVPESPKYLVTQGRYDEARDILIKIYVKNTGKPADTYPYKDIWKDLKLSVNEAAEHQVKNTLKHQLVVALHNIKTLFKRPLAIYLGLICLGNAVIMCMYNVYRLWFPQLFAIVENYKSDDVENLCTMLDEYTHTLKVITANTTHEDICVPKRSGNETYINSIIIGCVSLVPYLVTGILINKVGKKRVLIAAAILCMIGSLFLRWADSVIAIVALFAITIALSQLMLTLNQAFTVEIFGTTTRTFAVAFTMVCGRIGTLIGNVGFPILLNMGCEIPFYTMSGLMVWLIILAMFMPSKQKK